MTALPEMLRFPKSPFRVDQLLVDSPPTLCIARWSHCDLVPDGWRVSRRHAALHRENGDEYGVAGLDTPNGV